MTSLWRETQSGNDFIIQTDEVEIHKKLKETRKARLFGKGVNFDLWLYTASFESLEKAKNFIKIVTGKTPKYNSGDEVYEVA